MAIARSIIQQVARGESWAACIGLDATGPDGSALTDWTGATAAAKLRADPINGRLIYDFSPTVDQVSAGVCSVTLTLPASITATLRPFSRYYGDLAVTYGSPPFTVVPFSFILEILPSPENVV